MTDKVEIILAHPITDRGEVGDRLELAAGEARALVNAGYARYANKTAAKAAGADPETSRKGSK